MTINPLVEVQLGNTIQLEVTCRDFDKILTDPSNLTLKIYTSSGTVKLTKAFVDLTKASTGVWYYNWTPTIAAGFAIGDYIYEFSGTLNTYGIVVRAPISIISYGGF